jgi:hypothetical protein
MASHTPAELQRAAALFGELARAQDLDPATMAPAHEERAAAFEQAEPAYASTLAYRELSAHVQEPSRGRAEAPFDLERDGSEAAVTSLARQSAPFDAERESASGARAA